MRKKTVHNSILEEDQVEEVEDTQYQASADEIIEEIEEEIIEEYEEELAEEQVLNEAEARIEQANLYQALLKHQLFDNNSARPEIIDAVSKEFKSFILSRLEILLGIRQEKQQVVEVKSPFSEEEVEALKALARRMVSTNTAPAPQQAVQKPNPTIKPVATVQPVVAKTVAVKAVQAPQPVQTQQQVQEPAQSTVVNGKKVVRRVVKRVVQQPTQAQARLPQQAQAQRQPKGPKSDNVSIEGVNYAQAVYTAVPPKAMPPQAHIDMMNAAQAESNAKGAQGNVSASVINKLTR